MRIGKLARLKQSLSKLGNKVARPVKRPVKKFICENIFGKEKTFTKKVQTTDTDIFGNTIFRKETYTAKVPTRESYQAYKYVRNSAITATGLGILGGLGANALQNKDNEVDAIDQTSVNPPLSPETTPEPVDTIASGPVPTPELTDSTAIVPPADSIAADSVPAPQMPPAATDSVATDSVAAPPAAPVATDSIGTDSVAPGTVPPVAASDSIQVTPPAAPTDSVPDQQAAPTQPTTTEEKLAAQEERIKNLEKRVAELEGKTTAEENEAPANNIFGGEINEISTKTLKVNIKGDCLWNIAKRELQKANPGKRITNAQILKQVKEFGRINPEIYGENPSLESLNNLQFGQELKLCA